MLHFRQDRVPEAIHIPALDGRYEYRVSCRLALPALLQLDRLIVLIRALLDVTRIQEGQLVLNPEPFDLGELIREVREEARLMHPETTGPGTAGSVSVFAERERIRQVLVNLLSNAARHSPAGAAVHMDMDVSETEVRVSVRDHGAGVAPGLQEQIFERYFRVDAPRDRTHPGLGLGLYIAAEIIRRHGGRIWAERPEDGGARFVFTLPLAGSGPG